MFMAIMLVIGSLPTVASASPCSPCPPDCPMMKAAMADHHGKTSQDKDHGTNPCKATVICQTIMAALVVPQSTSLAWPAPDTSTHSIHFDLATPSRAPDRALRPPIQL
jgi:hypothetical protein